MAEPISIFPEDPAAGSISLTPTDRVPLVTKPYGDAKAARYAVTLGGDSPGLDTLRMDVSQGNNRNWDQILATNEAVQSQKLRSQLVGDMARNRDPNLPPSALELATVDSLSNDELYSPNLKTILNKKYAEKYVNLLASIPQSTQREDLQKSPEKALEQIDASDWAAQRTLHAQEVFSEISKRRETEGWLQTGSAWAKTLLPGYSHFVNANAVTVGGILQGDNLRDQITYLYSLPPEQFREKLEEAVKAIEAKNPVEAQRFAAAVTSYSTSDRFLGNLTDILDVVGLGGAVRAATRAGRAAGEIPKAAEAAATKSSPVIPEVVDDFVDVPFREIPALPAPSNRLPGPPQRLLTGPRTDFIVDSKGGVQATDASRAAVTNKIAAAARHNPSEVSRISGEVGLHDVAAKSDLTTNILRGDPTGYSRLGAEDISNVETRLPSGLSPGRAFSESLDMSATARQRSVEAIMRSQNSDLITRVMRVDRMEPLQVEKAAAQIFDTLKDMFRSAAHHVIDYGLHDASKDPLTNLTQVSVRFGQKDGTLFNTAEGALNWARENIGPKTRDYSIRQQGVGGYYVEVRKDVPEVGRFRDVEIDTPYKAPDTLSNKLLHGLKGADYLLPQQNVVARGRVLHSREYMASILDKETAEIAKMSKAEKAELTKLLRSDTYQQRWARSNQEFATNFIQVNGHPPTKAQQAAYETIVRYNDMDYVIRDADIVTQKARVGGENFTFKVQVPKGAEITTATKNFDGVVKENLPYNAKDPFFVTVVSENGVTKSYYSKFFTGTGDASAQTRAMFASLQEQGYKIVLDPARAEYFLVKNFQRDRVPLGSLGFKEGGHREYRYPYFVKQGSVEQVAGANRYSGDLSLANAPTRAHAEKTAKLLERGREMALRQDPGTKNFFDTKLSAVIDYDGFMSKVADGTININIPFVATTKGQRTLDVSSWSRSVDNFVDVTDNEHNVFKSISGKYIGEREDYILDVIKAENDTLVKTDYDALMDPFETMRLATQSLIDTRLMNDYKLKSAQDWAQEYGHLLDVSPELLRNNPVYYLENATYKQGADPAQRRLSENVRKTSINLMRHQTLLDAQIQQYQSSVVDWAHEAFGPQWAETFDKRILPKIANADVLMRSAAYQGFMGFFNVKQFLVQAQEVVKTVAISPVAGAQSIPTLFITPVAMLTDNPQALRGLANKWSKFMGWDKDDWLAMVDAYKRSGFSLVGHDQGFLEDLSARRSGTAQEVLDFGTTPFRAGESTSRTLAFTTAWREWHIANPGKTIDRFGESWVLQRAKDMTTNMGRDSNAAWQKGWLGVTTQFFGYQARFAEQMLEGGILNGGRKLTGLEKARLFAAYSALYGTAGTVSGVAIYPVAENIKDYLLKNGYSLESPLTQFLLTGGVGMFVSFFTGKASDTSQSLGTSGITAFHDLFSQDKTWAEVLGGASTGVVLDLVKNSFGAVGNVSSDLLDLSRNEGSARLLASDLLEPLRSISTVESSLRLWQIMNTNRWITRNGATLADDVSLKEGIMNYLTGFKPMRISEAMEKFQATKGVEDAQRKAMGEIRKWVSKASEAANKGDSEAAFIYHRRAKAAAISNGLTTSQYTDAVFQGWKTTPMTERAEQTYQKYLQRNLQNRTKE